MSLFWRGHIPQPPYSLSRTSFSPFNLILHPFLLVYTLYIYIYMMPQVLCIALVAHSLVQVNPPSSTGESPERASKTRTPQSIPRACKGVHPRVLKESENEFVGLLWRQERVWTITINKAKEPPKKQQCQEVLSQPPPQTLETTAATTNQSINHKTQSRSMTMNTNNKSNIFLY